MPACWIVIPAAGSGSRMGAEKPKQYLTIGDDTLLSLTLTRMASVPHVQGMMIALAAADDYWSAISKPTHSRIETTVGGHERCVSVYNAVRAVVALEPTAWVLVHDAARPCVRVSDIVNLREQVHAKKAVGGLLASPMSDTVKASDADGYSMGTTDRSHLWRALTPQYFPAKFLLDALTNAINAQRMPTDEAQAIEWQGSKPLLVAGAVDNIKVTHPQDRSLAAFILQQQVLSL
ncbi:MAG: 2-C-methyl-D-erythritol 4-phosphate cytidylyltransferase [Gammaproteobacteria bacterium]|nr:2-C-methyl-D-erythritol 4-phosphate cytidylyltransferase [Gammaproteobacteria bacterium]